MIEEPGSEGSRSVRGPQPHGSPKQRVDRELRETLAGGTVAGAVGGLNARVVLVRSAAPASGAATPPT